MEIEALRDQLTKIGEEIANAYRARIEGHNAMVHKGKSQLHDFTWFVGNADDMWMLVFNLPKEWAFVEGGRRPGKFPPPDAIKKWIQVKPIIPKRDRKTRKIPTTNQLAYMIGRKIAMKGIGARPILSNTLHDSYRLIDDFTTIISEAYGRTAQAELINIPQEISNIKIQL